MTHVYFMIYILVILLLCILQNFSGIGLMNLFKSKPNKTKDSSSVKKETAKIKDLKLGLGSGNLVQNDSNDNKAVNNVEKESPTTEHLQQPPNTFFACQYLDLKKKVSLITGGTRGIGFSVAKFLVENQAACVVIAGRDNIIGKKAEKTLNELCSSDQKVVYVEADVASDKQLRRLFEYTTKNHGRIDILLNSAAILNEAKWKQMIDVNLKAVIASTNIGLELMKKSKQPGVIVNLSSIFALEPQPLLPIFSASKAGVLAATIAFSKMKTENVRLVTACMGSTDTPMLLNLTQDDIGEWAKDNDIDLLDKLKNKQKVTKAAKCIALMMQFADNGSTCIVANNHLYTKEDETALPYKTKRI